MELEKLKALAKRATTVNDVAALCDKAMAENPGDAELADICAAFKKAPNRDILNLMAKQLENGYRPDGKKVGTVDAKAKPEVPAIEPQAVKPAEAKKPVPQAEKKDVGQISMG